MSALQEEKAAKPSLKRKAAQMKARNSLKLLDRVKLLEKNLANPKYNPDVGKTVSEILKEEHKAEAMATFRINAREDQVPLNQVYKIALAKMQQSSPDPAVRALKLKEFATLVAVDDIPSMLMTAGSLAYNLYKQNPTIKTFVDGLVGKGYNTVKDFLFSGSKTLSAPPGSTQMITDEVDAVCVDHLFGCMTKNIPIVSDPSDIPRLVYTSKIAYNFSVAVNSSGAAGVYIAGTNFAYPSSSSTSSFIGTNTANSYNPDSTSVTGSWVTQAGPLAPNLSNFIRVKFLGMEVQVQPFVSMNSSEGGYVCGFFEDQLSNSDTGNVFDTNVLTFGNLSQLAGFSVSNMKARGAYRSIPSTDRTLEEWRSTASAGISITPRTDYGTFGLIVKGADPTATIDFQISLAYSVLPDKNVQNLIRGQLPPLAPYTDQFMEYLRVRYPDIMFWDPSKIVELHTELKRLRPSYRDLVKHQFTPPVRVAARAQPLPGQGNGDDF